MGFLPNHQMLWPPTIGGNSHLNQALGAYPFLADQRPLGDEPEVVQAGISSVAVNEIYLAAFRQRPVDFLPDYQVLKFLMTRLGRP